ncbi:MAG: DUF1835 domain-containing protein [Candidatus Eremiobacteraeota bacterium]|nr:DUF1835 domain-containing protein [Candidatus Eremiobacteraeota bacterium]
MARSTATLHVTNGDGALYLLKKAGILGTHLAWRDALNDGPVPAGLSLEETSSVRANYLAQRGFANPIRLIHDFQRRDAQLRGAADFEEIVLWFEHDLFDQLQMLQVLTALEEMDLEPGRVAVVQTDHYLASMTVDEILPLLPKRRTATAAIYRSARRSWERFTSPAPAELYAAAGEDAIGLPFLRAALQRLCEEYPWTRDGLSRTQRHALYAVAQGPAREDELFARAQAREEAFFLGKRAFSKVLEDLRTGTGALIEDEEGTLVPTALGRRVIAGDADWLDEHPIDRWIGGVHLVAERVTRWDEDSARFL